MGQFSCQFCYTDLITEQKYPTHNQQILDMLYHTNDVRSCWILLKRVHVAFKHMYLYKAYRVITLLTINFHMKLDAAHLPFINLFLRRDKEYFLVSDWNDRENLLSTDNLPISVDLTLCIYVCVCVYKNVLIDKNSIFFLKVIASSWPV